MATKTDKKNAIRQDIIDSASVYSQNLAGKVFLYVYGDEYFEVFFPVDHFLHLTRVETTTVYNEDRSMKMMEEKEYDAE